MPTIHEFKSVDDYYSYTIIESNGIYKAFVTCQSAEKGIYRKDQLGKKRGLQVDEVGYERNQEVRQGKPSACRRVSSGETTES